VRDNNLFALYKIGWSSFMFMLLVTIGRFDYGFIIRTLIFVHKCRG
jgi:hypothetical protein